MKKSFIRNTVISTISSAMAAAIVCTSLLPALPVRAEEDTGSSLAAFSEDLGNLYGKDYRGICWSSKQTGKAVYNIPDLPISTAGSMIYDFDQDGREELLAAGINKDHTICLTMFELSEDGDVSCADTFFTTVQKDDVDYPVYVAEQGPGHTEVFRYSNNGTCICVDSTGHGMVATGRIRTILAVRYDGHRFEQTADPYIDRTSGPLAEGLEESLRGKLEAFGAAGMSDSELQDIYLGESIKYYLKDVKEVLRTETELKEYKDGIPDWMKYASDGWTKTSSIHFCGRNELYDSASAERYSKLLNAKRKKSFSALDQMNHSAVTFWLTAPAAHGKSGNMYTAGYSYISLDPGEPEGAEWTSPEELSLLFWETEDGIYLLPRSTSDEDLTKLKEEDTLPENAVLVYSDTEMPDPLEENKKGYHHRIEKTDNGTTWFHGYSIPDEGLESRDCLTLVWKDGEGLIGYKYSRTPAGADIVRVWDPEYLDTEDLGFKLR